MRVIFIFLVGSALFCQSCQPSETPTTVAAPTLKTADMWRMYVGTYTRKEGHVNGHADGIYLCTVNKKDGSINVAAVTAEVNPSFVAVSPNGKYMYCVNETGADVDSSGDVVAYELTENGTRCKYLNRMETGGFAPCYLEVHPSGKYLSVANYVGGKVNLFTLKPDGSLGNLADTKTQVGNGPHAEQESSHPHQSVWSHDGRFMFVPDKGANKVFVYTLDTAKNVLLTSSEFALKSGSGPRHIAFSPDEKFAYVIGENNSEISVLAFDARQGTFKNVQNISALPPSGTEVNHAAEIALTLDGRFLYATNRGRDAILAYKMDAKTGKLTNIGTYSTHGTVPRNFVISPDNRFVFVANQNTDNVFSYSINPDGTLSDIGSTKIATPVCLVFGRN